MRVALVEAGYEVRTYATGDSRPAGGPRFRFERFRARRMAHEYAALYHDAAMHNAIAS